MKMHTAFRAVLAAAKRDAKHPAPLTTQAKARKLREAIKVVELFRDDNHEFIEFYNDDAGLT